MAEVIRNRTIRPSTRLATSVNYRVDVSRVLRTDTLVVNISHESKSFKRTCRFNGKDVADKNSISFKVVESGKTIDIIWSGAKPVNE